MHEFSYAERILKTVLQEAEKHGVSHIARIRVVAGNLANLKELSLQTAFDAVSKGTIAESAKIELTDVEGTEVRVKDFDGE
jgi:hydrogenase nickel incorporation protein HypA/HybF